MTLDDLGRRRRRRRPRHENPRRDDERAKLTANYLNGISIAIIAIGVLRFVFVEGGVVSASGALWLPIAISVALHILALLVLGRFRGDG